jgi:pSer/pThr/pTyr-binding forkhead associated (FHA) protein
MIEYELGQWWLKDLQSTNGTFLNGERVEEPIVITDGDQIHCGKIVISVIKSS